MDDGDFLSEANASTVAMVLWFGSLTFTVASMAARTWLFGDMRAIKAALKFSPIRGDISQVETSFVSLFVLTYHFALFGFILLAAYVLEKHPPFPPEPRSSFDPDYLVFLVLLLVLYSISSMRRNDGRTEIQSRAFRAKEVAKSVIEEAYETIDTSHMSLATGLPSLVSRRSGRNKISETSIDGDGPSEQVYGGEQALAGSSNQRSDRSGQSSGGSVLRNSIRSKASESSHGSIEDIDFQGEKLSPWIKRDDESVFSHSMSESTISSAGVMSIISERRELNDIFLDDGSKQSSRSGRGSRKPGTDDLESRNRKANNEFELLNTDQTLEWKGILSVCFILYQLTAAEFSPNEINLFHNAARTGASCFVFMTGFGHATYFYTRNNYRFTRILKVLFRLNMTCFFLCLTMGQSYIYYYVCPLHSVAFLLTYGTMRINRAPNYTKYGLRIKLLCLAGLIFLAWDCSLGVFELLFNPIFSRGPAGPGRPNGPLWEWYYHSFLNHWSAFVGIIYAVNFPITSLLLEKTESQTNRREVLAKATVGFAFVGVMFMWFSGPFSSSKFAFDSTHPYFSFLPILSYVYFRNMSKYLRERHMAFLKEMGSLTLEVFLFHNHFFLSDDGSAILVLLPGYPKCNVLVTGIILILVAQIVNKLTFVISGMLLPSENETQCIRSIGALAGCTVGFYFLAFFLRTMGILNIATVGITIVLLGLLAYQTIMDMTWQEYRDVGRQLAHLSTEPDAESSVAKASPLLIGFVTVLVLGFSWQIMSIQGAFGGPLPLPGSCESFANNGAWTPVTSCNEFQRGFETRYYQVGASYRDCSDLSTLHWGWRKTESNSRCNFHYRPPEALQKQLEGRTIIFVGDSMVRNLFHALCRALGDISAGNFDVTVADHADIAKRIGNTRIEYKWAPLAFDLVSKLKDIRTKDPSKSQADIIVAGGGTLDRLHVWATDEDQESQKAAIQKLAKELDFASSPTIWCTPTTVNTPALGNDEKRNQMNELAIQQVRTMYVDLGVEESSNFVLDGPSYSRGRVSESFDGLSYPHGVYDAGIQILVNSFDWLLPGFDEHEYNEAFDPPVPGSMSNPFLGLMMTCFSMIGLFFFDGYFGFSYLSSLFVKKKKLKRHSTPHTTTTVMPNDLYEEAFISYHQKLKLPLPKGISKLQVSTSKIHQEKPQQSSFLDSDILSLLDNDQLGGVRNISRRK